MKNIKDSVSNLNYNIAENENMEEALISVIVPVYNAERYLDDCLASICSQTYSRLEIVAVNDGSTDNSLSILHDWQKKDNRIRIIDIPNGGVSNARNTGIRESLGRRLMFVDSDDIIWEKTIEVLYEAMERFQTAISCGQICYHKNQLGQPAIYDVKVRESAEIVEGLLYQTSDLTLTPTSQIFDRSLFSEDGLMFWEGLSYEDLELIPRLYMQIDRIAVSEVCVYYYRQHEDSFIHTFSPNRFDSIKAVESLLKNLAPRSERLSEAVNDRMLSASFNAFLLSAAHPEYKELNAHCWKAICSQRKRSLSNPKVRLKNKIGIILSYAGPGLLRRIGKVMKMK